jgi:hypothetical protein
LPFSSLLAARKAHMPQSLLIKLVTPPKPDPSPTPDAQRSISWICISGHRRSLTEDSPHIRCSTTCTTSALILNYTVCSVSHRGFGSHTHLTVSRSVVIRKRDPDGPGRTRTDPDGPGRPGRPGRTRTDPDGPGRTRTDPDGPRRTRTDSTDTPQTPEH